MRAPWSSPRAVELAARRGARRAPIPTPTDPTNPKLLNLETFEPKAMTFPRVVFIAAIVLPAMMIMVLPPTESARSTTIVAAAVPPVGLKPPQSGGGVRRLFQLCRWLAACGSSPASAAIASDPMLASGLRTTAEILGGRSLPRSSQQQPPPPNSDPRESGTPITRVAKCSSNQVGGWRLVRVIDPTEASDGEWKLWKIPYDDGSPWVWVNCHSRTGEMRMRLHVGVRPDDDSRALRCQCDYVASGSSSAAAAAAASSIPPVGR